MAIGGSYVGDVSIQSSPTRERKVDISTTDYDVCAQFGGMFATQVYVETGGDLVYRLFGDTAPLKKAVGDKSYHTLGVAVIYKTHAAGTTTASGIFVSAP